MEYRQGYEQRRDRFSGRLKILKYPSSSRLVLNQGKFPVGKARWIVSIICKLSI